MRRNKTERNNGFDGYRELRTRTAMTDEELRLALAEYGMEPITHLPPVLQALRTRNSRRTSGFVRSLYQLANGVLLHPGMMGKATVCALLLMCFAVLRVSNSETPPDSIGPISVVMADLRPAIHSPAIIVGHDSGSRVVATRRKQKPKVVTQDNVDSVDVAGVYVGSLVFEPADGELHGEGLNSEISMIVNGNQPNTADDVDSMLSEDTSDSNGQQIVDAYVDITNTAEFTSTDPLAEYEDFIPTRIIGSWAFAKYGERFLRR